MNKIMAIEAQTAVTSKGQTTIPKEMRDALGIKEGTPLRWRLEGGVLTVRPKSRRLEEFVGLLGKPPNGRHATIEELSAGIAAAAAGEMQDEGNQ
jgi:antitoxin PrlF